MKRYLHVIASANPAHGGPIEGIRQISAVTRRLGYLPEVASLDAPDEPFIKDFPLPLHALGPGGFGVYRHTKQLIPWLRSNAHNYDAIILNGIWTFSSFGGYLALRKMGIPYVVFTHGMLDPYFKKFRSKHLKKCLYWPWAEYRVLRDAASVCFTSEEEKVLARKSFSPYHCNETVVNYGTAGPTIGIEENNRQVSLFLDSYPELKNKRLLIFLSRIHPKKGCDLLVDAFAEQSKKYPELRLVMAGPDQVGWRKELEAIAAKNGISDRIVWTGMLSGDMKWGAFRSAEAFILPSHQENFGIVVAEALSCGTPALITNKVNIWQEIQSDKAGFVGNDDLQGVRSLLARWLELSPSERENMRENARTCFLNRFEIHKAADSLISVLSKAVNDKRL